jgi:hypothetical protein
MASGRVYTRNIFPPDVSNIRCNTATISELELEFGLTKMDQPITSQIIQNREPML